MTLTLHDLAALVATYAIVTLACYGAVVVFVGVLTMLGAKKRPHLEEALRLAVAKPINGDILARHGLPSPDGTLRKLIEDGLVERTAKPTSDGDFCHSITARGRAVLAKLEE